MRQAKRLFYIILLNVIISAITVGVVLQLWQKDHPNYSANNTPVVIVVTPTGLDGVPGTSENEVSATTRPTDSGLPFSGTAHVTPTLKLLNYRVQKGDTLGALAAQFNLSVEDIMEVNGLTDPNSISEGQLLHIPTAPLPRVTDTTVPPTVAPSPTQRPSTTPTTGPAPTITPTHASQEAGMVIEMVIGAGVLENERLVLQRTGDGELSLEGWRIEDGQGNEYIFPQLTLYEGGSINLNTRIGQDTVEDLFWDLTSAVWKPGKTVSLYDAQKELRVTYRVP